MSIEFSTTKFSRRKLFSGAAALVAGIVISGCEEDKPDKPYEFGYILLNSNPKEPTTGRAVASIKSGLLPKTGNLSIAIPFEGNRLKLIVDLRILPNEFEAEGAIKDELFPTRTTSIKVNGKPQFSPEKPDRVEIEWRDGVINRIVFNQTELNLSTQN